MAARSLGLVAALGLAANAFLLPPDVSIDSIDAGSDLDLWTLVDPASQPLLVPCEGCENDGNGPKNLFLDISVGSQPGTLELGGKPFYPPSAYMQAGPESEPTALAVPVGKSLTDAMSEPEKYTSVPVSGLTVAVHKTHTVSEQGEELIELTININEVNSNDVSVSNIKVQALKDTEARMTILSTSVLPGSYRVESAAPVMEDKPACESTLCKWREFVDDKVHDIAAAAHKGFKSGRPCPGKVMGMMKDGKSHRPFTNMHHGPGSHHHRPIGETGRPHHHHGRPKYHHGSHHFIHRAGRFIMSVAAVIFLGIAAGIVAYAAGFLVGSVIGYVVYLVMAKGFGCFKKDYASVAQTEEEAAVKDVEAYAEPRDSFESAPPVYEDAPAYEEKQVV